MPMDNVIKKLPPFAKGMLIYVAVFAVIAAAVLAFLYNYIAYYELSGSKKCLNNYMESLDAGNVPAACEQVIEKLDLSVCSKEENLQWISQLLSEAGYARSAVESGAEYEEYSIISRNVEIGKIRLAPSGEEKFGLKLWEVTEESYDLDYFVNNVSYVLPGDYTIQVGNSLVSAGTEEHEYKALGYMYDRYDEIPYMYDFVSGNFLGDAEIVIKDPTGKVLSEDQLTEQYFLNNCDANMEARLDEFGREFVQRYVDYGAVNGGSLLYNLVRLRDILDHECELYHRINTNWGSVLYSNTEYCKILSMDVNFCCEAAENLYVVDVSYTTETKGLADPVVSDNFTRVVASENAEGKLLVVDMFNY